MITQARYDVQNPLALERLLAAGVQTRPFAQDILTQAHTNAVQMYEELAAKDPEYSNIYTQWKKARDASFRWFGTAEAAYAQFSFQSNTQNKLLKYNHLVSIYPLATHIFQMFTQVLVDDGLQWNLSIQTVGTNQTLHC